MKEKNLRYKVGKLGVKMPILINLFKKVPWILFMAVTAVALGAFIALSDMTIIVYFMIVLGTFLLSLFLSVLFKHPKSVIQIILFSLSIRVFFMILLKIYSYQAGMEGFYPGDTDAYAYHGDALKALSSNSWIQTLEGNLPYTFFITFLYYNFGPDMNIPQLFNLGASVLIVPLIYELGNRVGGKNAGRTAAILWSLFPSAILWSISLLKDMFTTLGMVLTLFLVLGINEKKLNARDAILGICGIVLVSYTRPQFLLAIAIPILIMIVTQLLKGKGNFLRTSIFIILGVIFFSMTTGDMIQSRLQDSTTTEGVERTNEIALSGGSGIGFLTMLPPAIRWIAQLPFSIFAPFPWQWLSFSQAIYYLTALEMIIWYILYYFIWKNRKFILKSNTAKIILLYSFSIFIAVSFSLPNIGSIYRYRLAALTLLLPLVFNKPASKEERKE
jgi:hypothetical protein